MPPARLGHVAALDGVRGIAILLVLANHFLSWSPGQRGVDLFFVLSGFLITTLLLEEHDRNGRVSLVGFYLRRGRRLFPALGVMLLVYALIQIARGIDPAGEIVRYGFYTGNVYTAYVSQGNHTLALAHLWSLAEEEQFYLLWPLIVIVAASRRSRDLLLFLLGAFTAVSIYRGWAAADGTAAWVLYYAPWMHCTGLIAGAGAAVFRRKRELPTGASTLGIVALVGTGVIVVSLLAEPSGVSLYGVEMPLFELSCAAVILAAVSDSTYAPLGFAPLAWVGAISYSLYLWHLPLLVLFHSQDRLFVLALSMGAACASYYCIEQPARRRRTSAQRAEQGKISPAPAAAQQSS